MDNLLGDVDVSPEEGEQVEVGKKEERQRMSSLNSQDVSTCVDDMVQLPGTHGFVQANGAKPNTGARGVGQPIPGDQGDDGFSEGRRSRFQEEKVRGGVATLVCGEIMDELLDGVVVSQEKDLFIFEQNSEFEQGSDLFIFEHKCKIDVAANGHEGGEVAAQKGDSPGRLGGREMADHVHDDDGGAVHGCEGRGHRAILR